MKHRKGKTFARSFNTFGLFKDHETDWLFKWTLEYMGMKCAEFGECMESALPLMEDSVERVEEPPRAGSRTGFSTPLWILSFGNPQY